MIAYLIFLALLLTPGYLSGQPDLQVSDFSYMIPFILIFILQLYHRNVLVDDLIRRRKLYGFTWSRMFGWLLFELAILVMSVALSIHYSGMIFSDSYQLSVLVILTVGLLFQSWDLSVRSAIKSAEHCGEPNPVKLRKMTHYSLSPTILQMIDVYLYILYAVTISTTLSLVMLDREISLIPFFAYIIHILVFARTVFGPSMVQKIQKTIPQ